LRSLGQAGAEGVEAFADPGGAGAELGVGWCGLLGLGVLVEVPGDPGSGAALFAAVGSGQEVGVGVGDAPAFAVGGDVAGAADPGVAGERVVGHVAERGGPGRSGVCGAFAEFPDPVGDAGGALS
jgi:hypothetical protein